MKALKVGFCLCKNTQDIYIGIRYERTYVIKEDYLEAFTGSFIVLMRRHT